MIKYTEEENFIVRDNGDDTISWIPKDETNSDYQAYLNPVEHLTEIIPNEAKTKVELK